MNIHSPYGTESINDRLLSLLKRYWVPISLIALATTAKFIGFLRNAFIAYYFGTGYNADLLQILLFPTDFVTSYLINQTIITSLSIYFSRHGKGNDDIFSRIFHFYRMLLFMVSVVLAFVMVIMYPQVPWYYSFAACVPGIFYGMAGIMQGYLNYNRKFLLSGAQEFIASLVLLSGVIIASWFGVVWYIAIMTFTGLVRVLVQVPDLKKVLNGKSWIRELFGWSKVFFEGKLLLYIGPIIFTFILSGIPGFYVLKYLEKAGEGYIAAYGYMSKIIGLFNSIVVIPLTTYLIPSMQRWIEEGRMEKVRKINTLAFLVIGGTSIIASALSSLFPEVWVRIIYERGSFDAESVWLTSEFLRYHAFAMVGYALMYYLLQLALIQNQPKKLMLYFIIGTILILLLLVILPFAPYVTVGLAFTLGVMGSVIVLVL